MAASRGAAHDRPALSYSFTLRRSGNVNVSDYLPNGPHLEVNDAIELRAADAEVAPGRPETMLNAGESYFAYIDWQLSYLDADALRHRAAMSCYRFGIVRQPSSSRAASPLLVLGHVGQAIGSLSYFAVCPRRHARQEFAGHRTETRLSPPARPIAAAGRPLIVPWAGGDRNVRMLSP
jgi:hypothetical protein